MALYNTDKDINFVTKYNVSSIGFSKYYYRFIKDIYKDSDVSLKDKKVNGMPNLGNTCYMNSSLQCLATFPQIQNYFCDKKNKLDKNNTYFETRSKRAKIIRKRSNFNFIAFHFSSSIMQKIRNIFLKFLVKRKTFIRGYLGKVYKN